MRRLTKVIYTSTEDDEEEETKDMRPLKKEDCLCIFEDCVGGDKLRSALKWLKKEGEYIFENHRDLNILLDKAFEPILQSLDDEQDVVVFNGRIWKAIIPESLKKHRRKQNEQNNQKT